MSDSLSQSATKAAMLTKLADSGLNADDAKKLNFKPYHNGDAKALGLPVAGSGFQIPYFTLEGKQSKFFRFRYLEDTRKGFDKVSGKRQLRYMQPPNSNSEAYLPPYCNWGRVSQNTGQPLTITEGELKAAAVTKAGLPAIGLGGVWAFRSAKQGCGLLPLLAGFNWQGREVTICYDSDAAVNPNVVGAENVLAQELTDKGAVVRIMRLPPDPGGVKVGADDYLVKYGLKRFRELLAGALPFEQSKALHGMNEAAVYIRNPGIVWDYKHKLRLATMAFTGHAYADKWHDEPTTNGIKKVQTAIKWMQWQGRSTLDEITFAPGEPKITRNKLNLWEGWEYEAVKGNVEPWLRLMKHLFQNTELDARKWFEQWLAYPLQHPGGKMASGVLFWGLVQGSGKTLVGHTMMNLYGKYATEIHDNDLENPRNEWAENKQFVLADDITSQDSRKLKRRLMTMITQKLIRLDPKYIPSYTVPDCINYYFTSQDCDAFFMDDGDRRFFIHEVLAEKMIKDDRVEYVSWMKSKEGMQALMHYLLSIDLEGFDPHAEALQTMAKRDMLSLTKGDLSKWIADLKEEPSRYLKLPGDLFTASELLGMYDPMKYSKITVNGMARELRRAGFKYPGSGSSAITKFGNMRLYVIKDNSNKWGKRAKMSDIVKHYESNRVMDSSGIKGKVKF